MEKLAYSVAEAASILGWSRSSLYEAVAVGRIARVPQTGRRVLIAGVELERFAAQGVMAEVAS